MTTIAFVGLGQMGRGMAGSLLRAGIELRVWNRTPGRLAARPGLTECATASEAVRGVPFVISSLSNDEAVKAVTFGPDGILQALEPGAAHLGASTVSFALARTLVSAHAERRTHYLGTPVLGRPDAAERGALTVITGGPAEVVASARPLLAAIAQGTIAADSAPAAHLTKIIANLIIATTIETIGETIALAEKAGIAPARLIESLADTVVASPVLRSYGPRIARREFEPAGFRLELGLKDVNLALAAGGELAAPLPLASLLRDHLVAAMAQGRAQQDWSALAEIPRAAAGLR
jgi:3-hydroxyisobutyrate dehydrogenase-like beta-hydroxyacid dehydrogenase